MRVDQIRSAAKQHPYILLRTYAGRQFAINSCVVIMGKNKTHDASNGTDIISFRPCTFHEYISKKIPFV